MDEATVTVRGEEFRWSRGGGLDPAAVLEILPWIARCAGHYMRRAAGLRLERADLVQAGCVGALEAARTFDPAFGRTFLSWATLRIRAEMRRLCAGAFTEPVGDPAAVASGAAGGGDDALDAAQILSRLPRADRALLCRRFGTRTGAGATITAIAKERGASRSAVSRRLDRALHRARRIATTTRR